MTKNVFPKMKCPQHKLLFVESLEQGCMDFFFLTVEKFNYCHVLKAQLFSAQDWKFTGKSL